MEAAKRASWRAFWIGVAILVAGIIITAATYSAAGPGGKFVVAWGAIVFGVYRIARGFYFLGHPMRLLKKRNPPT